MWRPRWESTDCSGGHETDHPGNYSRQEAAWLGGLPAGQHIPGSNVAP